MARVFGVSGGPESQRSKVLVDMGHVHRYMVCQGMQTN